MDNKEMSILVLENMNNFYNVAKTVNKDRYNIDKNLTEKQFFALSRIKKLGKIELKNLSKDLNVSTSSLCILLNKLVERGYVYREEDVKDRRNTFYGITEIGMNILDGEVNLFINIISEKIASLSDEDKIRLKNTMDDLNYVTNKLLK